MKMRKSSEFYQGFLGATKMVPGKSRKLQKNSSLSTVSTIVIEIIFLKFHQKSKTQ